MRKNVLNITYQILRGRRIKQYNIAKQISNLLWFGDSTSEGVQLQAVDGGSLGVSGILLFSSFRLRLDWWIWWMEVIRFDECILNDIYLMRIWIHLNYYWNWLTWYRVKIHLNFVHPNKSKKLKSLIWILLFQIHQSKHNLSD